MRPGVLLSVLALLVAPQAQAFLLVGEDPEGDADHSVLGVVDVGGTISSGRTDILGLDVAETGGDLTMRLRIAEAPAGTGGYMYRVVFEAGGSPYWTCWTVQWVGGQVSEENIKGCSRFTEGTQVGPATTADGVVLGDEPSVQWTVPRSSVGGAGLADLREVATETWFRGGSTCCVGSTTDSQYHWSRSDLGPDEGAWSIVVPSAAPVLNVTLDGTSGLAVVAGGEGVLSVAVNATGAGNVSLAVEGVPANWTVAPSVTNLTAPANATVDVRVQVPADATAGVVELTLVARAGNQTLASVPLRIEVLEMEPLDDVPGDDGNASDGVEASADAPGPGFLLVLGAVGAVAVLRRRR